MKKPTHKKPKKARSQEELRMDNELKKLKLTAERGASFNESPGEAMPPDVESQWLDNIKKFDEAFDKAKPVVLYDKIGKPEFRKSDQVHDSELKAELERITELLGEHSIEIDTICAVPDRELYRFIAEELFMQETDDMDLPGFTQHYIYEEFHPNHKYDIERHCRQFVESLLDKERDVDPEYQPLAQEVRINGSIRNQTELKNIMEAFRNSYASFEWHRFELSALDIGTETATAQFALGYSAQLEGTAEKKTFTGKANFSMSNNCDYWVIAAMDVPGL